MRRLLFVAVSLLVLSSCTAQQEQAIKKAEWLTGTWENKTREGIIYETWERTDRNELSGKSYTVKGKDTIVFESIRLVREQEGLFYIPTVTNQNNDLPVRFAAKTISATQLVFENPQHDFPQIISYTKIDADSLVAEISGTENGQEHRQSFPMKRVKPGQ